MFGIKTKIKNSINKHFYYPVVWEKNLDNRVKSLREKDQINIAFIAMSLAMWKYQSLYDILKKDSRFKLFIVLSPSVKFSFEVRCRDMQQMRAYFSEKEMEYVDWDIENGQEAPDIRSLINPDILFYTQPGAKVFTRNHSFQLFKDKLLCYAPYGFLSHKSEHIYNREFLNIAWRIYYYTTVHQQLAQKHALNRGRNVVVSGYVDYDRFVNTEFHDVWKIKDRSVKRIIWAPHFTITHSLIRNFQPRSTFLQLSDVMLSIAREYAGKIQIAFKPHPRLLTELYNHPDWGKERANSYYAQWRELCNGQVETGDFVNLFHFSDALIHDSGSFVIDYMYFDKPEFFLAKDISSYIREADDLAQLVYKNIYHGVTKDEIINFIEEVVLAEKDTMKDARKEILNKYLLPPNGVTAAENIYNDLKKNLG